MASSLTPVAAGMDDAELVRAAQADRQAFVHLYRRYVASVYRYVFSRLGDHHEAEDLTSQVFLEALARLPRYREQGRFAAWLFAIARNRLNDHLRRRQRRRWLSLEALRQRPDPQSPDPPAQVALDEDLQRLNALIADLTPEQQELLRLRYAAGLSHAAIGELLGVSADAVKMRLHRLLRTLRARWEEVSDAC